MNKLLNHIKYIFFALRPRQWVKNLLVFAFLFYNRDLFNLHDDIIVILSFFVLIMLSSSAYLINDIVDYKRDRLHPQKKYRPIAAGIVSRGEGLIISIILFIVGLFFSILISEYLAGIFIAYYVIVAIYSLYLKKILIIDSLTTATLFVLRVMAGGVVIASAINSWFVIFIVVLSLFVSFGKRRAEITIMSFKNAIVHRSVLKSYPKELLDNLIAMTAAATFMSYILFSYNEDLNSHTPDLISSILPSHLKNPHWVKVTIPIIFYIIARYMYNLYVKKEGGVPETIWYKDKPLFIAIILYLLVTFFVLYIV